MISATEPMSTISLTLTADRWLDVSFVFGVGLDLGIWEWNHDNDGTGYGYGILQKPGWDLWTH